MKERRSLFSASNTPSRRKLFSSSPTVRDVICQDCGLVLSTAENVKESCPNCGGDRFSNSEARSFSRVSLFSDTIQREFSEPKDDFELALKLYSGDTLGNEFTERVFSIPADELVSRGLAERLNDSEVRIFSTSYLVEKVFSKLTITITKEMDLDEVPSRESLINRLADNGELGPRGIMLIKKAHCISPIQAQFSDDSSNVRDWVTDSGIIHELEIELGGSNGVSKGEFNSLLLEKYPDAPEGVEGYLINEGIIRKEGDRVLFLG